MPEKNASFTVSRFSHIESYSNYWFLPPLLHDLSGLSKELSESFSQLNELLSAAGFLKFSNETLEELKLRLPSKVEGQTVFLGEMDAYDACGCSDGPWRVGEL